ncbi:GIY-YIG nuclease family protein [Patescibacteria group bacterium]|nr:GIY-YIG nuclease family protein [Patescibacteria group bacterium]
MYYVYILKSLNKDSYYVGYTKNIYQRLLRHNIGEMKSTKASAPYKVIHFEEFETRSKAMRREQQIKSYKGGDAFRKLIVRA